MPPKPVRPPAREAQRAALEQLLRRDPAVPRTRLHIRLDGRPPTATELDRLGLGAATTRLVSAIAERQHEIARRATRDPAFAARFVTDPAGAAQVAGVAHGTIAAARVGPAHTLSDRIHDLVIHVGADDTGEDSASTSALVELLAATFAGAQGNPANLAALRTDPQPQVISAAAAHLPTGVTPGSPALASLITRVTNALLRAAAAAPCASSGQPGYPTADDAVAGGVTLIEIPNPGTR